jgi:hypothetical protein
MTKDYGSYFTLIALIHNILRSSSLYVRHYCVAAKEDLQRPLSYDQACKLYSMFKAAKAGSGNSTVKATDYLNYPKIGKLYQFELIFNKNYPVRVIEEYAEQVIYLSGTWNEWLINSTYYPDLICEQIELIFRTDLLKLTILAASPAGEGLNKNDYPIFFKMSKLSLRFNKLSTLKDKAEQLKL